MGGGAFCALDMGDLAMRAAKSAIDAIAAMSSVEAAFLLERKPLSIWGG